MAKPTSILLTGEALIAGKEIQVMQSEFESKKALLLAEHQGKLIDLSIEYVPKAEGLFKKMKEAMGIDGDEAGWHLEILATGDVLLVNAAKELVEAQIHQAMESKVSPSSLLH